MDILNSPHSLPPRDYVLHALATLCLLYVIRRLWTMGRRHHNMPPGPPTWPIIGNLLDMPNRRLQFTFSKWAKEYGDAISLRIFNQTIIVLHSPTYMKELIDKRSNASSNRPKSIIADMITGGVMNMGLSRYATNTWKALRKASNILLGPENIRKVSPYMRAESSQLMWELANQPDGWFRHIQRFTTSVLIGIVYGTRGPTLDNPIVKEFLEVHPEFLHCLEFGTMPPVDLFPILTYVPERFARWKRIAKKVRSVQDRLFDQLLALVEKRVRDGQGIGNYMEELLELGPSVGLPTRDHLMHLGATLLEGSDTSSATTQFICLALAKFPEVTRKAQQEIDVVVGPDRMPTENDLPKLKYMHAIIEEMFRFHPAGPLGVPHEMLEDTVVNGMFIPKDAVVFTNLYFMFRDERYFDKPEVFMPERFLKNPYGLKEGIEDDPARRPNLVFGGGKRVCPGIAFAKATMEINIANIIWGFDILPAIDPETGKELYPDLEDYTDGVGALPRPFPIRFRPRSAHHKDLIDGQFRSMADILSTYEYDLPLVDKEFNAKYRDL